LALVVIVLAVAGLIFYLQYVREENKNTPEQTVSGKTTIINTPSINVFRTPYFQFQASDNWAEVPIESNSNKFVYRNTRSGLVEHDITVYVNQTPANIQPTNVLPVKSDGGNTLEVLNVSENCGSALDKNAAVKDVQTVKMNNVEFLCYGKITAFNVIVGFVGGNTSMNLKRLDGSTAIYSIYYRDLRAIPGPDEIYQIARSFQTR